MAKMEVATVLMVVNNSDCEDGVQYGEEGGGG